MASNYPPGVTGGESYFDAIVFFDADGQYVEIGDKVTFDDMPSNKAEVFNFSEEDVDMDIEGNCRVIPAQIEIAYWDNDLESVEYVRFDCEGQTSTFDEPGYFCRHIHKV